MENQTDITKDRRAMQFIILHWPAMEPLAMGNYISGIAAGRGDLWDDTQFLSDLCFTKHCLANQLELNLEAA